MTDRRQVLKHSATVAALMAASGVLPQLAVAAGPAASKGAFQAKSMADASKDNREITAALMRGIVDLRRKNSENALSASPQRLKAIETRILPARLKAESPALIPAGAEARKTFHSSGLH